MWFAILLSVGLVAIAVFFGLRQGKVNQQLMDEGRIVQRKYVITEQAEEFTLRGADFARVLQGIQNADLRGSGVSVQKNDANQGQFSLYASCSYYLTAFARLSSGFMILYTVRHSIIWMFIHLFLRFFSYFTRFSA